MEARENAIRLTRQAEVANAPPPPVGAVNIPVAVVQIPAMAPIIRAEIPDIAPGEGVAANGDPVVCPREAARQAVEDERVRVLRYQEALLERRELEEVRYDPELDYSILEVCKNGGYYNNSLKPKNILLTSNLQDRASVGRNKPPAASSTSLGARRSRHSLSTSKEIERGMLIPTTEVKIKLNKNPKNSELILSTFQAPG